MHSFKKDSRVIGKEQQIKTMHMETIISTIVIIACTYFFTRRKVKPIEQGYYLRILYKLHILFLIIIIVYYFCEI